MEIKESKMVSYKFTVQGIVYAFDVSVPVDGSVDPKTKLRGHIEEILVELKAK